MLSAWENRKGGVPCSSERRAPHTPRCKITWVSDLSAGSQNSLSRSDHAPFTGHSSSKSSSGILSPTVSKVRTGPVTPIPRVTIDSDHFHFSCHFTHLILAIDREIATVSFFFMFKISTFL